MKTLSKLLVGIGAAGAVIAVGSLVRRSIGRKRAGTTHAASAGSMFVGAVDEVELGPTVSIDAFDPEEVASEHSEINELRGKMPFG